MNACSWWNPLRNLVSLAATWQIGRFGDDFAAHQTLGHFPKDEDLMRKMWVPEFDALVSDWCSCFWPLTSNSVRVQFCQIPVLSNRQLLTPRLHHLYPGTLKSDRFQNGTLPYWGFLKWGISNQWMVYTGKTVNMDDLVWIKPGVNLHLDATLCHILMKGKP